MRIVKNGDVHVSAPIGMPKSEVERFIEEHREWIAEALCDPMNWSPPGSSIHEILQARILECVAMLFRGSSQPRGQTLISYVPCIGS